MRLFSFATLLCVLAVSTGCAMAKGVVNGSIYSDVTYGNSTNAQPALASKMGEACANSILGIVATGDASITAAAHAGGIKHVTHIDEYNTNILGFYAKYCMRVYGN